MCTDHATDLRAAGWVERERLREATDEIHRLQGLLDQANLAPVLGGPQLKGDRP